MLIDNILLLKSKYPSLWNELQTFKDKFIDDQMFVVELSNNGQFTLAVNKEQRKLYIHSKYNPSEEAQLTVNKYDYASEYEHIFFYGIGLGYHIEAMMKLYPNKLFTIYEPNPAVIFKYLEHQNLNQLPLKFLKSVYIEWQPASMPQYLHHFVSNYKEKVLLMTHSSYERIFPEQVKQFTENFSKAIHSQLTNFGVNQFFERSWTHNSLMNFNHIIETQNMIGEKKLFFEGKPVILVAAGPSLEDEIEHLKYIKENKLAYIFSVGSANKALIKNGIYPDAVTSYDPWTGQEGLDVFSDITENGITTIPLIFGSSVGYNAVKKFSGPLLHMFINQDTISPFYLGSEQIDSRNSMLSDAPSIAVVTMQLLSKLGCNPIILVGQNFGYRDNQYYASGIAYSVRPTQLSEAEKRNLLTTEGVQGETVYTNKSFLQAKTTMEAYLKNMPDIEILNTTRGGVKIEGASFAFLDELVQTKLKDHVVVQNWYDGDKTLYNLSEVMKKAKLMEAEYKNFDTISNKLIALFRKMDKVIKSNDNKQMERQFVTFDKTYKAFQSNYFFKVFIQPMVRNQQQMFLRSMSEIRNTSDLLVRGKKVIEIFGKYIFECQREVQLLQEDYLKLQNYLLREMEVVN